MPVPPNPPSDPEPAPADEAPDRPKRHFAEVSETLRAAAELIINAPPPRSWIDAATSAVFVLSAIAVFFLLAIAMTSLGGDPSPPDDSSGRNLAAALSLRIAQIGLTIMAVSVTAGLICRFHSPWSMTFGLIIIGALIVPTSDIVRFILLITGSDRTYAEFYQRDSPKRIRFDANLGAKKAGDRCQVDLVDDIILYRIEERLRKANLIRIYSTESPPEQPKSETDILHEIITEELIGYMARESITNVVARGAADTLQAIASDDGIAFQTAFQDADGIREHVVFLRSEGLVEFPFDRVHLATLTDFGRVAFLKIAGAGDSSVSIQDEECASRLARPGILPRRRYVPPPSSEVGLIAALGETVVRTGGSEPTWLRFTVREEASYTIRASAQQSVSPLGDPHLYLFNSEGTLINSDDDGGRTDLDAYASQLVETLASGEYIIGVRDLDEKESSTFELSITK
jgi:hypothetical protein